MRSSDGIFSIALSKTKGVDISVVRAMQDAGISSEEFFSLPTAELGFRLGLREKHYILRSDRDAALEKARGEMEFMKHNGIRALFYGTEDYPRRLAEIPDAPVVLYILGEPVTDLDAHVSVVGTRRSTAYGTSLCKRIVGDLAGSVDSLLVVSGLAAGTDSTAHQAALDCGVPTLGVLGHGLDMIYPASNRNLAASIVRNGGALLTEYGFGTHPFKRSFLERNRIIAGMSDLTFVVESAVKGGAMSTARYAFEYSREVGALPGRCGDEMSEGCNMLIKRSQASLVESAADIVSLCGWKTARNAAVGIPKINFDAPEGNAGIIYKVIQLAGSPLATDEIILRSGLSAAEVIGILSDLEFEGLISCSPGSRYTLAY